MTLGANEFFALSVWMLIVGLLAFVWAERELRYQGVNAPRYTEVIAGGALFFMLFSIMVGIHAIELMDDRCYMNDLNVKICCFKSDYFEKGVE